MKTIFILSTFLIFTNLFAGTSEWSYVKTPRGADLEIKIVRSLKVNAPLLIVAPGQSCNSKGPLFDIIEQMVIKRDINLVRFEWSYCSTSSTNRNPSEDLSSEIDDMIFAINYSKNILQKSDRDLWIAGKSLGSMVAYQIFKTDLSLKSLTLLTPVCSYSTDDQNRPLPAPLDVINENYPELKLENRSVLLISGDHDSLCDHGILNNFKEQAPLSLNIISVKGDHGYSVFNADNTINQEESQQSKMSVAIQMFDWFFKIK